MGNKELTVARNAGSNISTHICKARTKNLIFAKENGENKHEYKSQTKTTSHGADLQISISEMTSSSDLIRPVIISLR
ncbi:hypothetical protein C4D60_Mb04t24010 [Musa balbisiana]|uniref:Uncharacterized protein n=1 Tax=Musa balbisiana TaxID=52838 RepID=A0A4S8KE82_MUSBA|nr:hypothetical protein C4D60_Mb04t24010 [Musa balbisiana]